MLLRNKRKLLVALGIASVVITGVAFNKPQQGFKNVKVLSNDISHDSLIAIMKEFNKSLGVKCGFCHAPRKDDASKLDFSSDEKMEKEAARHMIKMTRDINANYFNFNGSAQPDTIQVVGCVSCHRGDPHPKYRELYVPEKEQQ